MSEEGITDAPQSTDRRCAICTAGVAAFEDAMCCHCQTVPWKREQSSLPPVKGTIVERLTNEIDMMEMLDADNCSLSVNELRDIRAAIESMPIQKMVEGLEDARNWFAGYIANGGKGADEELAQLDSLLASVRSDGMPG